MGWFTFLSVLYVHKTLQMGDFWGLFGVCCV
jgi:hypothetical protein